VLTRIPKWDQAHVTEWPVHCICMPEADKRGGLATHANKVWMLVRVKLIQVAYPALNTARSNYDVNDMPEHMQLGNP
jgi:hypothetical protein